MSTGLSAAPIAAIRGGPGSGASDALAAFARRRQAAGTRVGGVIVAGEHGASHHHSHEGHGACQCGSGLTDLVSGAQFSIHQNLGPGSSACNLDTSGLAEACAAVERQIADGAELVVLSRFGGQEAVRGGLMAAFQAAVAAAVPVVCVVTPKAEAAWTEFAGTLSVWLPADAIALDEWWQQQAARLAA